MQKMIIGLVLAVGWSASQSSAAEWGKLIETRDALLADLEKKPVAQSMFLRLDEGADRDEMKLTLRRINGQWSSAYVEVPGWQQSTMQEWRGFYLSNEVGGCWRTNMRFPADTAGLKLDGNALTGSIDVAYRLDQTMLHRQPPGKRLQWWDKFIPGGYTIPRPQNYTISADVKPDGCLLDLVLDGGLYWDPKFNPEAKKATDGITRRPIYVRLQVPSTRFTLATARTPTWNGGFHEADAAGLKFAAGKLTGPLVVYIHQDGWMPWGGGGKHTQEEALPITFQLDAILKNNQLHGTYTASLGGKITGAHYQEATKVIVVPDTKFDGAVSGRGGKLVVGRYRATGALAEMSGATDGMLIDDAVPVRQRIGQEKVEQSVAGVNTVLHQIRALNLAIQQHPLPYDEAWAQTDMPEISGGEFAEYLKAIAAIPAPGVQLPAAKVETVGDSPSLGAVAAPAEGQTNVLPADAKGWLFLTKWNVLGSFEVRPGLENNTGLMPDIAVLAGAQYAQVRDRLGAEKANEKTVEWQAVTCATPRLGAPWEKTGMFVRYSGRLWYGAATIRSAQARTVWLSLEANDFGKVWINGQPVWFDAEKVWRYRPNGRTFVPVNLAAGENQILARIHSDRRLGWLRLALTTTDPATPQPPANSPQYANPAIFPDAQPPLAWDINKSINVAWRNTELAGKSRPVIAGDAVLVASDPGTLHCLDIATGKERWSAKLDGTEASEPLTDGKLIWFHASAVACYDLAGKQQWTAATGLARARLFRGNGRIVVEGAPPAAGGASTKLAVIVLDAATGKEQKRWDLDGRPGGKAMLLSVGDAAAFLASTGALLDIINGQALPDPDIEMQIAGKDGVITNVMGGPYTVSQHGEMFFLTSQARHQAVRLWARDGKLAYADAWESNLGNSGFGNCAAPSTATDKYLFTTHSSLAHTPHCPDPRAEINVQDAKTGQILGRLKPAMDDLYSYGPLNLRPPVIAGEYLFLLGGRADNKRNQITIATADEQLQLIANNDVDPGTSAMPVFAGGRMILRSPAGLTCIAVTSPDGKQYQSRVLAKALLKHLGPQPQIGQPREITGIDKVSAAGDVPVGKLLPERTTQFWLGAGPLSPEQLAAVKLPALDGLKLTPVDRSHAYDEPPMYLRTAELQGTGDLTPHFKSDLDPSGHAGLSGAGVFYTVLANNRDRFVVPVVKVKGVTQWLGGQELKANETLHLRAGLYPYVLKVDPEFFKPEVKQDLPIIDVSKALAAGAVKDIGWPKAWQVIGPIPGDMRISAEMLREMPKNPTIANIEYPVTEFPINANSVTLNILSETVPGRKPDLSTPTPKLTTTSPMAAYLYAAVECPADGHLYITAGADWVMQWFVDGVALSDEPREGVTGKVDSHRFAAKVTKGRHVVVAMVKPGAGGWQLTSIGAFSEKSPEQLPEFRLVAPPSKPADMRLNPSFREVPHPPTLDQVWRDRVKRNVARLQAVVRDLPGTAEAWQATAALEQVK